MAWEGNRYKNLFSYWLAKRNVMKDQPKGCVGCTLKKILAPTLKQDSGPALQTIFNTCISKTDLVKPRSQLSTKYLQSELENPV
jgi:hypothetical protein